MVLTDVLIDQKLWVLLYLIAFFVFDLIVVDQGRKTNQQVLNPSHLIGASLNVTQALLRFRCLISLSVTSYTTSIPCREKHPNMNRILSSVGFLVKMMIQGGEEANTAHFKY